MANQDFEKQFIQWYEEYGDALFRYCYFKVHDKEKAKDLVQEVFTRTWQYLGRGYQIENGRAFLYRVALHCIIRASQRPTHLSLEKLEEEQGFAVPSGEDESSLSQDMDAKRMIGLLEKLMEEKDREVIIFRYMNDLSPRDIAQITGESENVISVRLHRALKRFRKLLADHYEKV